MSPVFFSDSSSLFNLFGYVSPWSQLLAPAIDILNELKERPVIQFDTILILNTAICDVEIDRWCIQFVLDHALLSIGSMKACSFRGKEVEQSSERSGKWASWFLFSSSLYAPLCSSILPTKVAPIAGDGHACVHGPSSNPSGAVRCGAVLTPTAGRGRVPPTELGASSACTNGWRRPCSRPPPEPGGYFGLDAIKRRVSCLIYMYSFPLPTRPFLLLQVSSLGDLLIIRLFMLHCQGTHPIFVVCIANSSMVLVAFSNLSCCSIFMLH